MTCDCLLVSLNYSTCSAPDNSGRLEGAPKKNELAGGGEGAGCGEGNCKEQRGSATTEQHAAAKKSSSIHQLVGKGISNSSKGHRQSKQQRKRPGIGGIQQKPEGGDWQQQGSSRQRRHGRPWGYGRRQGSSTRQQTNHQTGNRGQDKPKETRKREGAEQDLAEESGDATEAGPSIKGVHRHKQPGRR